MTDTHQRIPQTGGRKPAAERRPKLGIGPGLLGILIWSLLLSGLAGCSTPPEPTATPTAIPTVRLELPTIEPTREPTTEPTAPPTAPLSSSPAPTEAVEPTLPEIYGPAMRPGFAEDLIALGPVSQYRIEVTVDPDRSLVSGREVVRYVNNDPTSQEAVYFRLYPNLAGYGGEMQVSHLQVEGQAIGGSLEVDGTALRVPLPQPLPAGGETEIAMDFRVTVPLTVGQGYAQFVYLQDVMALANFYPLIPAYDEENCARFGNCDGGWNIEYAVPYGDVGYSDTALYQVSVTAPEGWTVAASGSTVGYETGPEGQVTWHLVSGPMRDFNLVLSRRFDVLAETVEGVAVHSYFLPEDAAGGERALRWATDSLALFDRLFGPYPFAEFDVVATPTTAGGIEYPGLIVMPIRSYDEEGGFFQLAMIHEVAHQWWYSLVGNDQQDEPWLDEALAQYSTALYYELLQGWEEAGQEMFEPWYAGVRGTDQDGAMNLPVAAYSEPEYGPLVYGKGPLFFHALRQEVGDELFWVILQAYFNTYRYRIASGPDFLAVADQVSGADLSALYAEWLGAPE
jgi:hypothetical protein